MTLAWGNSVSAAFRARVSAIAAGLSLDPSWLMAAMAFETGATFSPSIRNAMGSGAVGLIQFLPQTLAGWGLTPDEAAAMTAEEQLDLVAKYFAPWRGRLKNPGDVYGAILWPAMIGKPDDWIVFDKEDPHHPALYLVNRGLDFDRDGRITRGEIVARLEAVLRRGLAPGRAA